MNGHIALIRLSWPTRPLWQNTRCHWSKRDRATSAHRKEAWTLALEQGVKKIETERPYLTFAFHPPDRRSRDLQNMPATVKAAIDGISDAMGIDDKHFLFRWPMEFSEVVPGGCVMIEVRACPSVVEVPFWGQIA